MAVELTVPVSAPGATQAAQQVQATAVAADKLATAETKVAVAGDRMAQSQAKATTTLQRAADAMKKAGSAAGGMGGGILSRVGGGFGGSLGLAGGGIAIAFAAATVGLQRLEAATASTEQRMTALAKVTQAATDAQERVRSQRAGAALGAAESNTANVARLLAAGLTLPQIQGLGPAAMDEAVKLGRRAPGQIGIAQRAAEMSKGALTLEDILQSGVRGSAEATLAKALGVSSGDLSGALARLQPAAGFFGQVGGEKQARESRLAADMFNQQQLTIGIANRRTSEDERMAGAKALADVEKELTQTLKIRAEAEGTILRIWRNSWLSSSRSARSELSDMQSSLAAGR